MWLCVLSVCIVSCIRDPGGRDKAKKCNLIGFTNKPKYDGNLISVKLIQKIHVTTSVYPSAAEFPSGVKAAG